MGSGMMMSPYMTIVVMIAAVLIFVAIIVTGLCIFATFLPVIIVLIGLVVLLTKRVPMPMNLKILVGFALILIGAVWLVLTW